MKIKWKDEQGQATVELAIVFPVVLIIACIALNAILCFCQCAKFDRIFKQTVCALCTSPGYSVSRDNINAQVKEQLEANFSEDNIEIDTSVNSVSGNYSEFLAELRIKPTLFGMGLKDEIFGIPLYAMKHQQKLTVDQYKPGIIF